VPPGTYTVSLAKVVDGQMTPIEGERSFEVKLLHPQGVSEADRERLLAERRAVVEIYRASQAADRTLDEVRNRLAHVRKAIVETSGTGPEMMAQARALTTRLADLQMEAYGDETIVNRNEPTPPALSDRINRAVYGYWSATAAPTETHRRSLEIASEQFGDFLSKLRDFESDLSDLEDRLEAMGAPFTPGRFPTWEPPG
jgi:uncharacterized coiled-coil protein SlyX